MQDKLYALALLAHPDDESFLLAGTTLKLEEEGKAVGVISATRGEKGHDRLHRNLSEKQMAEIRCNELRAACDALKCNCTEFLNYPDGGLDKIDFQKLVKDLGKKIEKYQPEIILTFGEEGISGHKDHIVIGKAAMTASKQAGHKPKEIWLASIPASCIDSFSEHLNKRKIHLKHYVENRLQGVADDKLFKIDVTLYAEQKHEAIKAHASQYLPGLVWEYFLEKESFEIIKL